MKLYVIFLKKTINTYTILTIGIFALSKQKSEETSSSAKSVNCNCSEYSQVLDDTVLGHPGTYNGSHDTCFANSAVGTGAVVEEEVVEQSVVGNQFPLSGWNISKYLVFQKRISSPVYLAILFEKQQLWNSTSSKPAFFSDMYTAPPYPSNAADRRKRENEKWDFINRIFLLKNCYFFIYRSLDFHYLYFLRICYSQLTRFPLSSE